MLSAGQDVGQSVVDAGGGSVTGRGDHGKLQESCWKVNMV
ncbi:hypothetical protein GRAN_1978 [Granulicella sibirica]|uniref:Uncharacterized protein n=1 Tax=Granulicella sibirica TaxID=2479048 RepID=A0A4Q0T916_9BACT|nr:hypothetical protein GRAN_1978 [Granulicella sibirica]